MFNPLFIFVEGADDLRFVQRVIQPLVHNRYTSVIPIECAHKSNKDIKKRVQHAINNSHEFWFLVDIDDKPCITTKKESVINSLRELNIDPRRIIVVIKEIEAWYLAGIENLYYKFRLNSTDNVTKEKFEEYAAQSNYQSSLDFQLDILQNYKLETARVKNNSLNYYIARLT